MVWPLRSPKRFLAVLLTFVTALVIMAIWVPLAFLALLSLPLAIGWAIYGLWSHSERR